MQPDGMTRALLAVIAVCLVILVAQGFGAGEDGRYRYQVSAIRAGTPLLIRTDTATGRVWKSELRGGRGRWIAFDDPEDSQDVADEPGSSPERLPEPPGAGASDPSLDLTEDEGEGLEMAAVDTLDAPREAPAPRVVPVPPGPRPRRAANSPGADFDQLSKAAGRTDLPPDIRIWALRLLGDSKDPRSTELLLQALGDDEPRVVAAAVGALGDRSGDQVTEALRKLENHADPAVQAALKARLEASS